MSTHDELVDDWLYSEGWMQVSSQDDCRDKGCNCETTGECSFRIFNHFMVKDGCDVEVGSVGKRKFPICLTMEATEELNVEEVRCKKHTTGKAYRYYLNVVLKGDSCVTMVSVATQDYKSTCFNVSCWLLETPIEQVAPGTLALGSGEKGIAWVLCRDARTNASVLSSLCSIGIDPVVVANGQFSLEVLRKEGGKLMICVDSSGFRCGEGGPNVLGYGSGGSIRLLCPPGSTGVRAVRTALITASILLTPKSMYGGKNPSTKTVTYFIHNICHSKHVQHV